MVTYLNLPSGAYFISNVAYSNSVVGLRDIGVIGATMMPIVVSEFDNQIASPRLCALSYIDPPVVERQVSRKWALPSHYQRYGHYY